MSKQVFALAREVPDSSPYLTAGKLYPVQSELHGGFKTTDDRGRMLVALWKGCAHLEGKNWARVEITEATGGDDE